MLIAVLRNKFIVSFIIIFGTLSFPTTVVKKDHFCLSVCVFCLCISISMELFCISISMELPV